MEKVDAIIVEMFGTLVTSVDKSDYPLKIEDAEFDLKLIDAISKYKKSVEKTVFAVFSDYVPVWENKISGDEFDEILTNLCSGINNNFVSLNFAYSSKIHEKSKNKKFVGKSVMNLPGYGMFALLESSLINLGLVVDISNVIMIGGKDMEKCAKSIGARYFHKNDFLKRDHPIKKIK